MANNDIRVNVSADVREAETALKRLEEQFINFQKASDNSSSNPTSSSSREIDDATRKFQDAYSNFTNSMQSSMDKIKTTMDDFNKYLEQAQRTSDIRATQSIQGQLNAFETQKQLIQDNMRVAEQMYKQQQELFNKMSSTKSLSLSNGGSGGSGDFSGFGGGNGGNGGIGNGGFSGPIHDGMPNSFNPNRTAGNSDIGKYFGGGGGSLPPPPSSNGGSSNSDGGSGNSDSGSGGNGGGSGLGLSDLLGGYMGVRVTHGIFNSLNSGYDLMDRDERTAYSIAQKTGDYGSDFTQARKDLEANGLATGHTMSETAQIASTYETIGGVTNTKDSLADVETFQKFGRAYAIDPNALAGAAGNMNRIGATQEGEQQKFASMLAQSIKEQGMSGRETELIESTNQLAQNIANTKTTVTSSDLTGIMAMQNMFGEMSPQLKGSQGASVLGAMNNNIQNADNGMQLLLGRNTEFTGPEGMLNLRKQMEKGISDPQNLARILQNSEKMAGGNKSYQELILMDKLGISSSVADQLLSDDNYNDLKSGKRAQSEIEKITSSSGDLDNKYNKYNDSDVNRRDKYKTNKENSSKATGDIEDDIVTPWQDAYNSVGTAGQIGMNMIGGLAGAGAWSFGSKIFGTLFKGGFGGLGDLFKGKGPFGGGSGGGGAAAGGLLERLGGFAKAAGKFAGPAAAGFALYNGYKGWDNADEDFKTDNPNITQKLASAEGAAINGLTFGLPDKFFGKGAVSRFLYDPLGLDTPVSAAERESSGTSEKESSDTSENKSSGTSENKSSGTSENKSSGTLERESSDTLKDTVNKRKDQQKEWKDILQTESDIVKRREDLNKNTQNSQGEGSTSSDATSNFWNNANNVNQSNNQNQSEQQKSWLDEVGDWFSGLFGGDSSSSGLSSGSTNSKNLNGGMDGDSELAKAGSGWEKVDQWDSMIQKAAKEYGVDPNLIKAVMMQESSGINYDANSAGAVGLMQITQPSAQDSGIDWNQIKDPQTNINAGAAELARDLKYYNGDIIKALAAYNAGIGNVDSGKYTGFSETMNYIEKVPQYYQELENKTPKKAIGSKSLNQDGLIYAHKGEQIVRADENPNNPSNVSTSAFINGVTGGRNSVSTGIGSNLNLTITVNGQGFTAENQNKVANAAIQVINSNQPQLLDLLANGTIRTVR